MGLLLLFLLIALAVAAVYLYQQRPREKSYQRPDTVSSHLPLQPLPHLSPKGTPACPPDQAVQAFETTVLPTLAARNQLEYQCLKLKAKRLQIPFPDFFAARLQDLGNWRDPSTQGDRPNWDSVILGMVEELRQQEAGD
jgi:hypothetical protein